MTYPFLNLRIGVGKRGFRIKGVGIPEMLLNFMNQSETSPVLTPWYILYSRSNLTCFRQWRRSNNQVSTFLMLVVFKASSTKCVFVWRFFLTNCVQTLAGKWSIFLWNWQVQKFCFVVKFQRYILDESHQLLVLLWRFGKSVCNHLDYKSALYAVCILQSTLQLRKKSAWPPLRWRFSY